VKLFGYKIKKIFNTLAKGRKLLFGIVRTASGFSTNYANLWFSQ